MIAGMIVALEAGSTSPELVAIEARKADNARREASPLLDEHDLTELGVDPLDTTVLPVTDTTAQTGQTSSSATGAAVISLHSRRELPVDTRPPPSVAIYDQLLSQRRKGTTA